MNAAPCSWRVVMCRTVSVRDSASRMSIVSSPGTEKTHSAALGVEAVDEQVRGGPAGRAGAVMRRV